VGDVSGDGDPGEAREAGPDGVPESVARKLGDADDLAVGLSAGYDLTHHLTLFARGGGSIWFDGPNQFAGDPFAKEVSLYQTGGVRVSF